MLTSVYGREYNFFVRGGSIPNTTGGKLVQREKQLPIKFLSLPKDHEPLYLIPAGDAPSGVEWAEG